MTSPVVFPCHLWRSYNSTSSLLLTCATTRVTCHHCTCPVRNESVHAWQSCVSVRLVVLIQFNIQCQDSAVMDLLEYWQTSAKAKANADVFFIITLNRTELNRTRTRISDKHQYLGFHLTDSNRIFRVSSNHYNLSLMYLSVSLSN